VGLNGDLKTQSPYLPLMVGETGLEPVASTVNKKHPSDTFFIYLRSGGLEHSERTIISRP
jgi:hypothetical protein